MRGLFSLKSHYDVQLSAAYAVYMIAGSLFAKTSCSSELVSRMHLHYAETPVKRQLSLEDSVIRFLEKQDDALLPRDLSLYQCEVFVKKDEKGILLTFYTGVYPELCFLVDAGGSWKLENRQPAVK